MHYITLTHACGTSTLREHHPVYMCNAQCTVLEQTEVVQLLVAVV